jgi:hypothetical protein
MSSSCRLEGDAGKIKAPLLANDAKNGATDLHLTWLTTNHGLLI